eukprot:gene12438-13724_t
MAASSFQMIEQNEKTSTHQRYANKRGRPGKKENKEWQDEEIFTLINIWSTKEELFNCRDEKYLNRDNRSKAIDAIRDALTAKGCEVDNKQIQDKITNLRNYFAAELRKIEASKKSGAGSSSVYKSTWKFFPHLSFLQDNFIPRQTSSNLSTPPDQDIANTAYPVSNAPSAKKRENNSNCYRESDGNSS